MSTPTLQYFPYVPCRLKWKVRFLRRKCSAFFRLYLRPSLCCSFAAGIYGVLSYTLTRRTREMGIRIALGASAKDIAGLFVSEAAAMIALGTLIGVPAALAAVTLLRSQLFGVAPHDPTTLA